MSGPTTKIYPDKFAGQVIVITGAAQGIGETTAQIFAQQGATVALIDVQKDKLQKVLEGIESAGGNGSIHPCDISDQKQCHSVIEAIISQHGKIEALIQLAAIYPFTGFIDHPIDLWEKVQKINVNACFYLTQSVLPHMQKAGYGRLINTASGTFQYPGPGLNAYVTSKGAIIGFTRQIAAEAGNGITANVVMPGLIETEQSLKSLSLPDGTAPEFDNLVNRQCVKRRGLPKDVAHTICFMASPEASFITAQIFDCGGGATFH